MKTQKFAALAVLFFSAAIFFSYTAPDEDAKKSPKWTEKKANEWYDKQPWLVGANFLPSNAINQLEMWQAETWSPDLIDKELGWAADLGMNTMRVYLHD